MRVYFLMCVYVCGIGNDAFTFCNFFGRRLAFFPRVCFVPTRRFTKVSGYCDEDPRIFVLYPPRAAPCHSSRLIEGFLRARADKKERAAGASIWNLSLSGWLLFPGERGIELFFHLLCLDTAVRAGAA